MKKHLLDDLVPIDALSCGETTIVGYMYGHPPPYKAGNCFSVNTGAKSYRILNFYHENLEVLLAEHGLTWPIKILPVGDRRALLHDPRIPNEWYRKDLCLSCTPWELISLPERAAQLLRIERGERTERWTEPSELFGEPMPAMVIVGENVKPREGLPTPLGKGPVGFDKGFVWAPYVPENKPPVVNPSEFGSSPPAPPVDRGA